MATKPLTIMMVIHTDYILREFPSIIPVTCSKPTLVNAISVHISVTYTSMPIQRNGCESNQAYKSFISTRNQFLVTKKSWLHFQYNLGGP